MAMFDLYVADETRTVVRYIYDSEKSAIYTQTGQRIKVDPIDVSGVNETAAKKKRVTPFDPKTAIRVSPETPGRKIKRGFKVIKIQLGLGCNYDCAYCLQATQPRTGSTPKEVDDFVAGMSEWVGDPSEFDGEGLFIDMRGGEPLVYWKTLKPLAEKIKSKYPKVSFGTCTNGSLLTLDKNEWFDRMGFTVAVSHDGPGQHVRGPDPFEVPEQREAILDLYRRLAPQGRMSFSTMMNAKNTSRAAVQEFFVKLTGDSFVPIGEGTIIDSYDDSGVELSLDPESSLYFRRNAFLEYVKGSVTNFATVQMQAARFVNALAQRRHISSVMQKCGMDMPDQIAVDMKGNVLTCQNVQASETGMDGNSHKIGEVTDIDGVRLNTVKHWENRKLCKDCPVLLVCGGSCMYLDGEMFDVSCENKYADSVVFMAIAVKHLFGGTLVYIDGKNIPEHRKNVFGMVEIVDGRVTLVEGDRVVVPQVKKKKFIPIAVAK